MQPHELEELIESHTEELTEEDLEELINEDDSEDEVIARSTQPQSSNRNNEASAGINRL
jgi:hypothetical protein